MGSAAPRSAPGRPRPLRPGPAPAPPPAAAAALALLVLLAAPGGLLAAPEEEPGRNKVPAAQGAAQGAEVRRWGGGERGLNPDGKWSGAVRRNPAGWGRRTSGR